MGWRIGKGAAALLLAGLLLAACGNRAPSFHGTVVEPPEPAPDFRLTDQHGQPFRLSDQQGKVVLLFFGFTHCPDVCPTTLAKWRQVEARLGQEAEQVRFVFITVDPERDTPERLAEHLTLFSPDFIGLTGDEAALERVYQDYFVAHEKVEMPESALEYVINHNSQVYAIDRQGRWRLLLGFDLSADEMAQDIRRLLRE